MSFIVKPLLHNKSYALLDFIGFKTVININTGYINGTDLAHSFKTKNGNRKEIHRWMERGPFKDAHESILKYLNNSNDLINGDVYYKTDEYDSTLAPHKCGGQEGNISLAHSKDGNVIYDETLKHKQTLDRIKGTYLHPLMIVKLLEWCDKSNIAKHSAIVVQYAKDLNFKECAINDNVSLVQYKESLSEKTNLEATITNKNIKDVENCNAMYEEKIAELQKQLAESRLIIEAKDKKINEREADYRYLADECKDVITQCTNLSIAKDELKEENISLENENTSLTSNMKSMMSVLARLETTMDKQSVKMTEQSVKMAEQSTKMDILIDDNKILKNDTSIIKSNLSDIAAKLITNTTNDGLANTDKHTGLLMYNLRQFYTYNDDKEHWYVMRGQQPDIEKKIKELKSSIVTEFKTELATNINNELDSRLNDKFNEMYNSKLSEVSVKHTSIIKKKVETEVDAYFKKNKKAIKQIITDEMEEELTDDYNRLGKKIQVFRGKYFRNITNGIQCFNRVKELYKKDIVTKYNDMIVDKETRRELFNNLREVDNFYKYEASQLVENATNGTKQ